jgi:class 3 adenylate cyclase
VPETGLAERRLVTVLFADLVAFSDYSEGRDPEVVRETLSRYFEATREIIERRGGVASPGRARASTWRWRCSTP